MVENRGENYIFTDSDSDPDFQPAGPPLLHFRSTCMNNLQQCKQSNWKRLLEKMVELPTPFIRLYDEEGNYTGIRNYKMGLENVTQPLDSSACALPDCEPIPHPNDEVTGHTSESEDDEYDILLCEQEDESENCLQDSTVTLDLPNKLVSTCQSTSVETSASLSTCLLSVASQLAAA